MKPSKGNETLDFRKSRKRATWEANDAIDHTELSI